MGGRPRARMYAGIIDADKQSQNFLGHGSAMAQAYSHMIMPLANSRDKLTQVIWGIGDFRSRFGRRPKGCGCRKRRWIWSRSI